MFDMTPTLLLVAIKCVWVVRSRVYDRYEKCYDKNLVHLVAYIVTKSWLRDIINTYCYTFRLSSIWYKYKFCYFLLHNKFRHSYMDWACKGVLKKKGKNKNTY